MLISGTGITPFTQLFKPRFRPRTKLALKWRKLDNTYFATDRGATSDIYESDVRIYGKYAAIKTFVDEIEANRQAGSNEISLSNFNTSEWIFGADVDYTGSIDATWIEHGEITQGSFKGFGINLRLRAIAPSFVGSPSLPALTCLEFGYNGDATFSINKMDSYGGNFFYADRESDLGYFIGIFKFSNTDMQDARRYIATQRSSSFSLPAIPGVTYPFGPRRPNTSLTAHIQEWEDMGMWGLQYWRMKLKFTEVR